MTMSIFKYFPIVYSILHSLGSSRQAFGRSADSEDASCNGTTVPQNALVKEAVIQRFNGELLASRSATMTLEKWCRDHNLTASAKILARNTYSGSVVPPLPEIAQSLLQLTPGDRVKYRHVELHCGDKVLSLADNWYVVNRLTREMNDELDYKNTPFGKAVASFQPFRQTYAVRFLWHPLPAGWDMRCGVNSSEISDTAPERILEHQAIVLTKDALPIAFVHERYTKSIIDF